MEFDYLTITKLSYGSMTNLMIVVIPILFVFCVFGFVFLKREMKNKQSRYKQHISSINGWDCLQLLVLMLHSWPAYVFYGMDYYPHVGSLLWIVTIVSLEWLKLVTRIGIVWQYIMLAFERLFVVWQPFRSLKYLECLSVSMISVLVLCLAVLLGSAHLAMISRFEWGVNETVIWESGIPMNESIGLHRAIPFFLLHCPTPCCTLLAASICTWVLARRSEKQKIQKMPWRCIILLSISCCKFVFANSLVTCSAIGESIYGSHLMTWSHHDEQESMNVISTWFMFFMYSNDVTNLLLALHCSTNWLLFAKFGEKEPRSSVKFATTSAGEAAAKTQTKKLAKCVSLEANRKEKADELEVKQSQTHQSLVALTQSNKI